MKICLIRPALKERENLHKKGLGWDLGRNVFNRLSPIKIGQGNDLPPLALMLLASMTPPDIYVFILDEEIGDIDYEIDVDLVGISILTTSANRGYEIADNFKHRGVKVVIGGMHATVLPKEAAEHADAVVIGQAEGVWEKLIEDAKVGNLQKYYSSEIFYNMQNMPIPKRDILDHKRYLTLNTLQATRGCPNRCSFCSIHAVAGDEYRYRPVHDVVAEILSFKQPLAVFIDDNIVGDADYAKKLFKALIPLNIFWFGQATISIVNDDELLKLAAKSGCKSLIIGFESLSQSSIRKLGKGRTNIVSDYFEAVKKIHELGISIAGTFILGLDDDDESVFEKTIEFIQKSKIDFPHAGVLIPYPGTRMFKKLYDEGRILHTNWQYYSRRASNVVYLPKKMSPEQLYEGQKFICKEIFSVQPTLKRLSGKRSVFPPAMLLSILGYNLKQREVLKHRILNGN